MREAPRHCTIELRVDAVEKGEMVPGMCRDLKEWFGDLLQQEGPAGHQGEPLGELTPANFELGAS